MALYKNSYFKIDKMIRILFGSFFITVSTLAFIAPVVQTMFGYPKGENIYGLLSPICHQYPTRSLWIMSRPFALCGRCFGGYLGLSIGFLSIHSTRIYSTRLLMGVLLVLPGVLDGITQLYTHYESINFLRLLTGILGGIGIFYITYPFKRTILVQKGKHK